MSKQIQTPNASINEPYTAKDGTKEEYLAGLTSRESDKVTNNDKNRELDSQNTQLLREKSVWLPKFPTWGILGGVTKYGTTKS